MPTRATKRGDERTRSIATATCSSAEPASPASRSRGKLAGTGADVLIDRPLRDRRAADLRVRDPDRLARCARPARRSQQTFAELVIHTPHATVRYAFRGRSRRSTTGRSATCSPIRAPFEFETAKVESPAAIRWRSAGADFPAAPATASTPFRPTADDPRAADRRRARLAARARRRRQRSSPPMHLLSRGLEVHPHGARPDLEVWIDRSYVPAGYGWSFPADGEVRIGVGSFDPRFHVQRADGPAGRPISSPTRFATRATGSRTRFATPPRTACSSPAIRPATACR